MVSALAAEWIEICSWSVNVIKSFVSALAAEWIEIVSKLFDHAAHNGVSALAAEWIEILSRT